MNPDTNLLQDLLRRARSRRQLLLSLRGVAISLGVVAALLLLTGWAAHRYRYSFSALLTLRIGAGKRMPVHGHGGTEITQILRGAYDDALGHFAAGDVADLDADTEHQPVTSPGEACICVAALDAPLRFPGWFARKLQPLFGI